LLISNLLLYKNNLKARKQLRHKCKPKLTKISNPISQPTISVTRITTTLTNPKTALLARVRTIALISPGNPKMIPRCRLRTPTVSKYPSRKKGN
jgi:hypothetical protein